MQSYIRTLEFSRKEGGFSNHINTSTDTSSSMGPPGAGVVRVTSENGFRGIELFKDRQSNKVVKIDLYPGPGPDGDKKYTILSVPGSRSGSGEASVQRNIHSESRIKSLKTIGNKTDDQMHALVVTRQGEAEAARFGSGALVLPLAGVVLLLAYIMYSYPPWPTSVGSYIQKSSRPARAP